MKVLPHSSTDITTLKSKSRCETKAKQRDCYRAVVMALERFTTEHIMYTVA